MDDEKQRLLSELEEEEVHLEDERNSIDCSMPRYKAGLERFYSVFASLKNPEEILFIKDKMDEALDEVIDKARDFGRVCAELDEVRRKITKLKKETI